MGRESLLVPQVPRWMHTCTFSSYFQQNPSGRINFTCWKWLFKARHLRLSFPGISESGQQWFSPYHGQHPHPIPWAASLPHAGQDLSRMGRSLSWVWGTGTIWVSPTASSRQCLGMTAACPNTGARCYLSHSAVNGITLAKLFEDEEERLCKHGQINRVLHLPSSAGRRVFPIIFPSISMYWRRHRSQLSSPSPPQPKTYGLICPRGMLPRSTHWCIAWAAG